MPNWPTFAAGALDLLAMLGGGAFVWRLVDVYRDRVRVEIAGITYEDHGEQPTLSMEVDNNGRHPILLKRQATLRGLSLGFNRSRRGGWVRARMRVRMRLTDEDRTLQPISSRVFRWKLDEEDLEDAGLEYGCWLRARIRISNRSRSLVVRLPRVWGDTLGPLRYWMGYACFRYAKYLTPAARRLRERS